MRLLVGAFAAVLVQLVSIQGWAQDYPPGRIRIITPYAAGGPADLLGRIISDGLQAEPGRVAYLDTKGGAGGNLGSAEAARSKPDGLTLLLIGDSIITVNPHVYRDMNFNPRKDLIPVAIVGSQTLALSVNKNTNIKSVKELIERSKTQPVKFSSGGIGSPGHLGLERFKLATGIQAIHVPYKGGAPSGMALLSGDVDATFVSVAVTVPNLESGKITVLAVSDDTRHPLMPTVPTMIEAGIKDFTMPQIYLVAVPAGTPKSITDALEAKIKTILEEPAAQERVKAGGINPRFGTGKEAAEWLDTQYKIWGDVAKASNMTLE